MEKKFSFNKSFTREEVLNRFKKEIELKHTLFMASCGTGIVAKFLEKSGCDMAGVYNASYSERFEAFCVKLGYAFKDIVSAGASVRFEPSSKIDLDVSL